MYVPSLESQSRTNFSPWLKRKWLTGLLLASVPIKALQTNEQEGAVVAVVDKMCHKVSKLRQETVHHFPNSLHKPAKALYCILQTTKVVVRNAYRDQK